MSLLESSTLPSGQDIGETQPCPVLAVRGPKSTETQLAGAYLGDDSHTTNETQDIDPVVAQIIQLWRMRQRWHRAEKSLILQGRSLCRSWTRGEKQSANALFDKVLDGESVDPALQIALMPFVMSIQKFRPERAAIEKQLRAQAKSLPIYKWTSTISGFGTLNLAALIGESGDIGNYRNPSCLWKRMGMAVIDGGRQRRVTNAEQALLHGYNPARRAVAYLLGECLIKAGSKCRYRPVYTKRREATAISHSDWSDGHSHNDAMRVTTKIVLRDLWVEWRSKIAVLEV